MTEQTQHLINQAKQLPVAEQAALIDALLHDIPAGQQLDGGLAPDIQQAWLDELNRRAADTDNGGTPLIPHKEAWPRIAGKHA